MGTSFEDALANCSAEPIHIPGAIQPFGVLLVLDGTESRISDLRIVQHSINAAEIFGATGPLLGRPIGELIPLEALPPIDGEDFPASEPVEIVTHVDGRDRYWHAFVHRHLGQVILELEADPAQRGATTVLGRTLRVGLQAIHES